MSQHIHVRHLIPWQRDSVLLFPFYGLLWWWCVVFCFNGLPITRSINLGNCELRLAKCVRFGDRLVAVFCGTPPEPLP